MSSVVDSQNVIACLSKLNVFLRATNGRQSGQGHHRQKHQCDLGRESHGWILEL
jgi:hypothetical protein